MAQLIATNCYISTKSENCNFFKKFIYGQCLNYFRTALCTYADLGISILSYTMLFPPVIHNFRYKAREQHGNE